MGEIAGGLPDLHWLGHSDCTAHQFFQPLKSLENEKEHG